MSITLSSMTHTATLNQSANLAVAKHGGIAIDPFGAANQRVEQQLNSTAVKLSSFSQIKSGFADVQTAAKDLSDPKKTATSSDIANKDTLSKIGKQAEQVSAKELATTGNVGSSVNTLSNISKNLETQLAEQKRLATASQDAVQRQVANITNTTAGGVASYLQTLSL